jgi:hypothetical protein
VEGPAYRDLRNKLNEVFQAHTTKYSTTKKKSMSSYHIRLAKNGLMQIQVAIGKSVRKELIKSSFELTGIYPFDMGVILDQCTTKPTDDERLNIVAKVPSLVNHMLKFGEISDVALHRAKIIPTKLKDHLVLNRRRSIIITNRTHITAEHKKREDKARVALEAEDAKKKRKTDRETAAALKKRRTEVDKAVVTSSDLRLVLTIPRPIQTIS